MDCPNSDPEFNKIIGEKTPEERSNLFVVCVLVRTLLYSGVYHYIENPLTPIFVGIGSLISVYQLSKPTENRQWWSKKFQLIMSLFVLLACIVAPVYVPLLLFSSLFGGVLQRLSVKLC